MTDAATDDIDPAANALATRFLTDRPREAAQRLETMQPPEAADCLADLPADVLARLWEALAPGFAAHVFPRLRAETRRALLEALDSTDAAALIAALDEDEAAAELETLAPASARTIRELLAYPPDTAGRFMDTRITALHETATAGHAMDLLRRQRRTGTNFIKVVDADKKLTGLVDIRSLLFASRAQPLAEIMAPPVAAVGAMDTREEIARKFEDHDLRELPVIDLDGHVLGVIRHDQLVGALRHEMSADMLTMVGASREERALSPSSLAIRKRMPWLQINLLTAFLAASVVGLFESTIAQFTALAVLLPVVAGQSGNAGAQALAVTMRGLALREIHFGQWPPVVRKEILTGFWNGVSIAVTCAIGIYLWSGNVGLVLVIVISMIISMVAAGIAGAMVPITLSRLGQDPAVASSIILTTVTDVVGFFSFLGTAALLAGMLA